MVKNTQTIRRQKPTNCLSVFDHFVGLALKWLRKFDILSISILQNTLQFNRLFTCHSKAVLTYKEQNVAL